MTDQVRKAVEWKLHVHQIHQMPAGMQVNFGKGEAVIGTPLEGILFGSGGVLIEITMEGGGGMRDSFQLNDEWEIMLRKVEPVAPEGRHDPLEDLMQEDHRPPPEPEEPLPPPHPGGDGTY